MINGNLVQSAFDLLSDQQKRLVQAYTSGDKPFDQAYAMDQAGYAKYANTRSGQSPFKSAKVLRAINEKLSPMFSKAGLTSEQYLAHIASIAYADPRELVDVRRVNCRYCNGIGHNYQWSLAEYNSELAKAKRVLRQNMGDQFQGIEISMDDLIENNIEIPDDTGGYGFDQWSDPNEACPECFGHGEVKTYIHPSFMNHPLYGGAKVDKNGNIEIIIKNQADSLKMVGQLQGFFIDKQEITHTVTGDTLSERRKRAIAAREKRNEKK